MPETLNRYYPPLTPEISIQTPEDSFSTQEGIETANITDKLLRLRSRVPDYGSDRILPTTEAQEVEKTSSIDPEKYSQDVIRIGWIFNSALGIEDERGVIRNYYPALARAMWEQMETQEQEEIFIKHETTQVITTLGERYNVVESVARYSIDSSSKLRSEAFPTETFEAVVRRGIEYRRNLGSPDTDREEAQLRGILKVQDKMADSHTPVGFKMVAISGPGLAPGTTFTHNFVDIYELKENPATLQRYVEMTRFTSSASYEQYKERVARFRPNYFNDAKGEIGAYFSENPIDVDPRTDSRSAEEIFQQLSGIKKDALSREDFQKIVEEGRPRVGYYLKAVCESIFNPQEVALRFNAILKGAEFMWKKIKGFKEKILDKVSSFLKEIPIFKTLAEEVNWLGRQIIEKILAACGISNGFTIGKTRKAIGSFFSGTFGSLGRILANVFKKSEWFCKNCPICGVDINDEVKPGESCPNPQCEAVRECA